MSSNKVIWSEGLFLRPQHLQQQDRYLARQIDLRSRFLRSHGWGLSALELEADLLRVGKFGVRAAAGLFPDGTPFSCPDDDPLPLTFDVPPQTRDEQVYLVLPLRAPGRLDFEREPGQEALARHHLREAEVNDVTSVEHGKAEVEVAPLKVSFLIGSSATEGYNTIPVAHIVEVRADRTVVLDANFMPTVLDVVAAPPLNTFMTELLGMVRQRASALAGRVAASGRGGVSEIADFLLLQVLNRHEPLLAHWCTGGLRHPVDLYELGVALLGELSTFTSTTRRPAALPAYRHEALRPSFEPLISGLRASLTTVLEQTAIAIPLEKRKYGISTAQVNDRTLLDQAAFVLAVHAEIPIEELRQRFPAHLKIGPVDKIRDLVNLQLPGIGLDAMQVAPRQIPYHAGFVYFELNSQSAMWKAVKTTGGLAFHVAGEFPGLAMEFWAIRG